MQHDAPFSQSSSASSATGLGRDENKLPFDHEIMSAYLPPFIQPEHQPATSDINLLQTTLPSNMSTSLPSDPYFQKPNEEVPYNRTQRDVAALSPTPSSNTPTTSTTNGGLVAGSSGTPLSGTSGGTDKVVMQTLNVDLLKLALGSKTDILPSLSRPAFIPGDRPTRFRFVLGTEEQNPLKLNDNKIIFGQLTHDPAHNVTRVHVHITYPIPDVLPSTRQS
jgi:hypothetical protein